MTEHTTRSRLRRVAATAAVMVSAAGAVTIPAPDAVAAGDYADHATVGVAGNARYHGSTGPTRLNARIRDMVATTDNGGYWLLAQDGGVFTFGNAGFFGSTGSLVLNQPVQAMAVTASSRGYWFAAADGGLFAFGDARFNGSVPQQLGPGRSLNAPVVGMVPTSTGQGYWMVASDGGVFSFGDAHFVGSLGGQSLPAPIVAFAATPSNRGYWMVDKGGRTYAFGDAPAVGGAPLCRSSCSFVSDDVVDAVSTPDGRALVVLWEDGRVVRAPGGATPWSERIPLEYGPNQQAVALDVTSDGGGVWVASSGHFAAKGNPGDSNQYTLISGRRWSPCLSITWFYNPSAGPPGGLDMFDDAFAYLAELTGLPFRYGGETTTPPSSNRRPGTVVVGFSTNSPPGGWAQGGGARTQYGDRQAWGWVELDARQVGGRPITFAPSGFGGIALHEIGHVIGLGHPSPHEDLLMANGPRGHVGIGDRAGFSRLDARHGC